MLNDHEDEMDEIVFKRCAYVINENKRVHDACNALIAHDLKAFGNLMYQSHKGLQKNYEVSCKELDILVDATKDLDGILGARMMGGGFGGCTINLVYSDTIQDCMDRIKTYYNKKRVHTQNFM